MLPAARHLALMAVVLVWACDGAPPSGLSAGPGAGKVLRVTFQAAETGFDPVKVSDYYSGSVIEAIYDPLLTYDYLARPAKLTPNVAESLPTVSADGRTYMLRIREGVHFTPDSAFKGATRELTAADYAYSFKRFLDPRNRSPYAFLFEGKVEGLDELAARAKSSGRFDYDAPVSGLEAVDRYTLRIRLKQPDGNFPHVLAFPLVGAVAREVVEAYGDDIASHPVGTGPFHLQEYTRSSRIVLQANPGFRSQIWNFGTGPEAGNEEIVARMKGKKLPRIDRVEISIMEEAQSRWLAFQKGQTDIESQVSELAPNFMTDDGRLKPDFAARGIRLDRSIDPEIIYLYFNVQERIGGLPNPLGFFTTERIALRRAIAMSYNVEDQIRIIRKGQAIRAQYPIPPGVAGHDPNYRSYLQYDPRTANALLDKFGYRRGPDGYRAQPDGSPLIVRYSSIPTERDRQFDELMKRSLDSIGIRLEIHKERFAELIKLGNQCRIMMKTTAWIADYPDGDNFMQLLYGPNTGQTNSSCYRSAEFDRRYETSRRLPDGPERDRLYREMTRLMEVQAVWLLTDSRYRNVLLQPHVIGFRQHPVLHQSWRYIDMEPRK